MNRQAFLVAVLDRRRGTSHGPWTFTLKNSGSPPAPYECSKKTLCAAPPAWQPPGRSTQSPGDEDMFECRPRTGRHVGPTPRKDVARSAGIPDGSPSKWRARRRAASLRLATGKPPPQVLARPCREFSAGVAWRNATASSPPLRVPEVEQANLSSTCVAWCRTGGLRRGSAVPAEGFTLNRTAGVTHPRSDLVRTF